MFYEYLQGKGLNPCVQFGEEFNRIDRISGYKGTEVHPELNLRITGEVANAISRRLFNASQNIPGTRFCLPAYEIDASSLIKGELRYNGVLFGSKADWKKFFVMPSHQLFEWTIKVPSADFIEKTNVCVYRHGEDSVAFKFDIKIGEINIILRFENNKPVGAINIETKLYKTYKSSSEALHWVDVPIALIRGELVNFQLFGIEEAANDSHPLKEFIRAKLYYQTIKRLELENNVTFSEYTNYSENGLMCALILRSYFCKQGIGYPLIKTFKCELEASQTNIDVQELVKQGKPNVIAVSYVDFKGVLNGFEFKIPYVNICLQHCIVTDYHLIEGNRYSIAMIDKAEENLIYGSDISVNQNGNIIHIQG